MDVSFHDMVELLVDKALLSRQDAQSLQQDAVSRRQRPVPYLVTQKIISAKILAQTLATHFHLTYIDLDNPGFSFSLSPYYIQNGHIFDFLQTHHILPLGCHHNTLYIAIDDPSNQTIWSTLPFHTGFHIRPMVADTQQLSQHLQVYLRQCAQQHLSQFSTQQQSRSPSSFAIEPSATDDTPVVQCIDRLLIQAISQNASDIHFEPYSQSYRVRFRHNGLLNDVMTPPLELSSRIAARIKIMAGMDISERRLPQDGRFSFQHQSLVIECRVSSCPTVYGEKIAIRLFIDGIKTRHFDQLTLSERDKRCFLNALSRSQGLILVTGPTGSGKSTTLYAALEHLNTGEKNILTVEDPVEIKCHGINQVQVNHKIGLGFPEVLRTFLRQDPDVLMIGEIRDNETAEIAIKAAQTGHLVLATLHTNSAADSITRLIHFGIPPYQLIGGLHLVVAQRLIRLLCPFCKKSCPNLQPEHFIALEALTKTIETKRFYQAAGCAHCHNGYHSRSAIFEIMPITPGIQQLLVQHPTPDVLALCQQAQSEGMKTLLQSGLSMALDGSTSLEEVSRVAL